MATNTAEGEISTPVSSGGDSSSTSPVRARTRTDSFLIVCRCFSVITVAAALLCIAVNILAAVRSFKNVMDVSISFNCSQLFLQTFGVYTEMKGLCFFSPGNPL